MGFQDVIKNSILETLQAGNLFTSEIIFTLVISCLLGVYIYLLYRLSSKADFYSRDFNKTLAILPMITASIILAMQANLLVSLGMVGALSIVRFRTAVKDPLDLMFLFWAIGVGIICGAGFSMIAVTASVVLYIVILFFSKLPSSKGIVVLLVNSSSYENEVEIMNVVKEFCSVYKVKARNLTKNHLDMAIEVSVEEQGQLVRKLMDLPDVTSASIVSHEGEVTV